MKFLLLLSVTAVSCLGIQAWEVAHLTYPTDSSSSLETNYVGKLITNENGLETCIGTFSGSNVFHNQNPDDSWDLFSQRCRDLVGGLVLMMSNTANTGCKGGPTSVDLNVKTRINNNKRLGCEPPVIQYQPVAAYTPDDCTEPPVPVYHPRPQHYHIRPKPRPVTPVVVEPEPVPVIVQPVAPVTPPPTREVVEIIKEKSDEDCDDDKHEHHHKHHKHHHKHHDQPVEYIREIRESRPRNY